MTTQVTAAPPSVHVVQLSPTASGQLFAGVGSTNPAAAAVEPLIGQTAPWRAIAIGPEGATPINEATAGGSGFWRFQETVAAAQTPAGNLSAPYNGLETSAEPMISLTSVSMPSSYLGESLTGLNPDLDADDFGTSNIFPGIDLVTTEVSNDVTQGVGDVIVNAEIKGNILELNSWVQQWQPTNSVPKFNGSDYARVRSEGFGRDNPNGFVIEFTLKFFCKQLPSDDPRKFEKTYTINVINNFENDKNQYISDYKNAYLALDKVPEISERIS